METEYFQLNNNSLLSSNKKTKNKKLFKFSTTQLPDKVEGSDKEGEEEEGEEEKKLSMQRT